MTAPRHHCPHCGYDVADLVADGVVTCPECGRSVRASELIAIPPPPLSNVPPGVRTAVLIAWFLAPSIMALPILALHRSISGQQGGSLFAAVIILSFISITGWVLVAVAILFDAPGRRAGSLTIIALLLASLIVNLGIVLGVVSAL